MQPSTHALNLTSIEEARKTRSIPRYLLTSLANMGVEYFFMVPGKLINPIMSCYKPGTKEQIMPVLAGHESGAAMMADGYARASETLGVTIVIDGPGAINTVPGVANAAADGSPLMVITGLIPKDFQMKGAIQDSSPSGIDMSDIMKPMTAASFTIENEVVLPRYFESAIKEMFGSHYRPAYFGISKDTLLKETESTPVRSLEEATHRAEYCDLGAIRTIFETHIKNNSRVCFMVGNRCNSKDFGEALSEFSRKYQIPVATSPSAKGLIPDTQEAALGVFGYSGHKRAIQTMLSDDVNTIIFIGYDFTQWTTLAWHDDLPKGKTLIQVDRDQTYLSKHYKVDHGVVADAKSFLSALELIGQQDLENMAQERGQWLNELRQIDRLYEPNDQEIQTSPLHPARVVHLAREAFPKNAIAVADAGVHRSFAIHYWDTYAPKEFYLSTTFAPMGWAVPAATGVSFAKPDQPVVVFTGDGCMLMSGMEIQTAAKHDLNMTFIVMNNAYYGASYFNNIENIEYVTKIPDHDWATFARAFGLRSGTAHNEEELQEQLKMASEHQGPYLIDVKCDHKVRAPAKVYVAQLKTLPAM
ncbi:MAG: thiamine pyrophosphate-binding protein [Alphaproteobacteria bacterium]|nr:thiamine pyrophosphate-binding protein [Alphaproteobacteria bacterium]